MRYAVMPRPQLSIGNFELRAVQPTDIESIRQWRNAQMDVLRQKNPIDVQQQVDYYEQNIWPTMAHPKPPNILLGLEQAHQLIGYGGLVHINWEDSRSEVSFLLSPEKVKDSLVYTTCFSNFLFLIKQLAFEDLKLHRLFTETYNIRPLHISILEANSFIREGVLRDNIRINDHFIDSILHGCLTK
ncbi:GNAT family N-acetyltransferase [Thiolinea disciformis]|uniref:GNAT family N-acetyltransferase n=1 Tax=Thiolinea disciformis TaxID=125614 RepID=UPI0003A05580|nr:GNAT family N-acetyltransferase [Thiolinea disciformis]